MQIHVRACMMDVTGEWKRIGRGEKREKGEFDYKYYMYMYMYSTT